MMTHKRNFVWDLVVSTLFVAASAWAAHALRAPETIMAKAAVRVPACYGSVLRWPKDAPSSYARERSETHTQAVP